MGLLEQYNFGTSPELLFCPLHLRSNSTTDYDQQQCIEQNQTHNNKSNFMIEDMKCIKKYAYDPILRLSGINVDKYESYFDTSIESSDRYNIVKSSIEDPVVIHEQIVDTISSSNTNHQASTVDKEIEDLLKDSELNRYESEFTIYMRSMRKQLVNN